MASEFHPWHMRRLTGVRAVPDRKNIGGGGGGGGSKASTIVKEKGREKPDVPSVGAPVSPRRPECRVTRRTGEVGGFMVRALQMSEEDEELWDQRQRARPVDFVFVKYKMFTFKYIKIGLKRARAALG